MNNLVWVQVPAAEDHVLQVAADLGLGRRLPPPVRLQGRSSAAAAPQHHQHEVRVHVHLRLRAGGREGNEQTSPRTSSPSGAA